MRMKKGSASITVDIDTEVHISESVDLPIQDFVDGLDDGDAAALMVALQSKLSANTDFDKLYLALSTGRDAEVKAIASDILYSATGRIT